MGSASGARDLRVLADDLQVVGEAARPVQLVVFAKVLERRDAVFDIRVRREEIRDADRLQQIVADNVWAQLKPIVEAQPRRGVRGGGPPGS